MSAECSFDDLMARLRAGDRTAAEEVFDRYTHRLIALARQRLDQHVRRKVDPEDILQSVYKSFFRRQADGRLDPESWDHLWFLLTALTVRKCGRRADYFHAARRDVQREVPLPTLVAPSGEDWDALAPDPTPSEAARLAETVEQVMRHLEGRERDMLALSLQGYTTEEISGRVGRSERTVQRVLKRVRGHLERMQAEYDAAP